MAPPTDKTIRIARFFSYPKTLIYVLLILLAFVSALHFLRLAWRRCVTARLPPTTPDGYRYTRPARLRFPVALLDWLRAQSMRRPVRLCWGAQLNLLEGALTLGYAALLLGFVFANTTTLEGQRVEPHYYANRAGTIAASQFPIMTALGMRNNPFSWLTGISFDKLNYLHRMAARVLVIVVWIHAGGRLTVGLLDDETITHPWVRAGFLAAVTLTVLALVTFRPLRKRAYEWFMLVHGVLGIITLLALLKHLSGRSLTAYGAWPSLLLWGADRALRGVQYVVYNYPYFLPGSPERLYDADGNEVGRWEMGGRRACDAEVEVLRVKRRRAKSKAAVVPVPGGPEEGGEENGKEGDKAGNAEGGGKGAEEEDDDEPRFLRITLRRARFRWRPGQSAFLAFPSVGLPGVFASRVDDTTTGATGLTTGATGTTTAAPAGNDQGNGKGKGKSADTTSSSARTSDADADSYETRDRDQTHNSERQLKDSKESKELKEPKELRDLEQYQPSTYTPSTNPLRTHPWQSHPFTIMAVDGVSGRHEAWGPAWGVKFRFSFSSLFSCFSRRGKGRRGAAEKGGEGGSQESSSEGGGGEHEKDYEDPNNLYGFNGALGPRGGARPRTLVFVVRVREGMTRALWDRAAAEGRRRLINGGSDVGVVDVDVDAEKGRVDVTGSADKEDYGGTGLKCTVPAFISGPYSNPPVLVGYHTIMLIAGGTGVAFTFPLWLDVVERAKRGETSCEQLVFIWSVRDIDHLKWIESQILDTMAPLLFIEDFHMRIRFLFCITGRDEDTAPTALAVPPPNPEADARLAEIKAKQKQELEDDPWKYSIFPPTPKQRKRMVKEEKRKNRVTLRRIVDNRLAEAEGELVVYEPSEATREGGADGDVAGAGGEGAGKKKVASSFGSGKPLGKHRPPPNMRLSSLMQYPGAKIVRSKPPIRRLINHELNQCQGTLSVNVCGTPSLANSVREVLRENRMDDVMCHGPTVTLHVEAFGG